MRARGVAYREMRISVEGGRLQRDGKGLRVLPRAVRECGRGSYGERRVGQLGVVDGMRLVDIATKTGKDDAISEGSVLAEVP